MLEWTDRRIDRPTVNLSPVALAAAPRGEFVVRELASGKKRLIYSSGFDGAPVTHGLEIPCRRFSGAHCVRVIGAGDTKVEEHSHDWPVLSLYVMGECRKMYDGGDIWISGPSAVLHGISEAHANAFAGSGLEQIDLQFDPDWLGDMNIGDAFRGMRCWLGGEIAAEASRLVALWLHPDAAETDLRERTASFLTFALRAREEARPAWLDRVTHRLARDEACSAVDLAREVGLHPGWLAQAYRRAAGEGLRQTVLRQRVQRAVRLLESAELSTAEIAADTGFCDQSHMNRAFRNLLGRTPVQVRAERRALRRKVL